MFPNLDAEMAREKIGTKELADIIGVSLKTANNKLVGRTEFTLSEIMKIAGFFNKKSIDYLFSKEKMA